QLTFNQLVAGSNPARPTKFRKKRLQGAFFVFSVRYPPRLRFQNLFSSLTLPDLKSGAVRSDNDVALMQGRK
ncbi:hypothetical protein, partial [Pantoea sp.]|uniref:hypothetical protein n=1 Tax=Pantoea sp. TaxID=69393 RepID=UPI00289EBDB6